MRILVTGGAGFIGSHYVRTVLGDGYPGYGHAQVTVLDKLTHAANLASLEPVAASPRFSFVRGDIGDAALLASLVPGHDVVINFAAQAHSDPPAGGPAGLVAANVAGLQVLLQACLDANVGRVVQVSTDDVYGSVVSAPLAEGAPLDPDSLYAAAKAGGDLLALAYARSYGLDVSITRCCATYGPYQHPARMIPLLVTNLIEGLKLPLQRDGRNSRSWVHVDDHCQGIQAVLEHGQPGRVYHIAGGAELSDRDLTQALLDCFGAGWDMVAGVEDHQGRDRRHSLDDSALRQLGYFPQVPLLDGLRATAAWYQDNRQWWQPLKEPGPGPGDLEAAGPGSGTDGAVSARNGTGAAPGTRPRRRLGSRRRRPSSRLLARPSSSRPGCLHPGRAPGVSLAGRLRRRWRGRRGEGDVDGQAAARPGPRGDGGGVGGGDGPDNRQAKAVAAVAAGGARARPLEGLEQAVDIGCRDARPGVGH